MDPRLHSPLCEVASYVNDVNWYDLDNSFRNVHSSTINLSTALLLRDYSKMFEYFSFLLQCTTTIILGATAYYLYSLIKMANEILDDLVLEVSHDPPKSEVKQQKLIECVLTRNCKQYLGKLIPKNKLTSSVLKIWINSSAIMKQNFQANW